jgi:hypothetical protein
MTLPEADAVPLYTCRVLAGRTQTHNDVIAISESGKAGSGSLHHVSLGIGQRAIIIGQQ